VRAKTNTPAAVTRPILLEDLCLEDLEAVRLVLSGGSVIDWHRLGFSTHGDVDRFLRVNEFDPDSREDMARLEEIRMEAVEYLTRTFSFTIPDEVAEEVRANDLFLMASKAGKHQRWACVLLKVMHIIHHLAGRELLVSLNISDDAIFHAVELKVVQVVEELRAAGYPIDEFAWSRKPRDSLITKLLAKRSTLAAKIYDKLRFRLVVRSHADIVPMLAALTRQLIPFNYVIPGESVNQLLSLDDAIAASEALRQYEPALQDAEQAAADGGGRPARLNEFSGPDYKIINFVTDLPLRVDGLVSTDLIPMDSGHVVFALTEFQVCDKATAVGNEQGECSHDAYKSRQHERVRLRLMRGDDS
jgi:uncharacterized protein (TIGR04552 family)